MKDAKLSPMEPVPGPQKAPTPQPSPTKRCPSCSRELPADLQVCPDDGAALVMMLVDATEPQEVSAVWEAAVQRDILIGSMVGGYMVRRRIGAGGMGIVYEAEQPQIGRKVAVKILRPDVARAQRMGLVGEARASGRIRHRAIVDVFAYGEIPSIGQYIVMEYLEGRSLDVLLEERGGPLSVPEVLWLLDEVLAGLCAAHAEGVIHRDLKPSNLFLVSASGGAQYVKILDFGLAKTQRPGAKAPPTLDGKAVGTPEYMAPEQVRRQEVSERTDLYSLGVIAFEMLTGQRPFHGETPLAIAVAQVQEAPPRPSQVAPVPEELDALVLQLLEKDPDRRPADAAAVRREVKELTQQLGTVTKITKRPVETPAGLVVKPAEPERAPMLTAPEPATTPASRPTGMPEPATTPASTLPGALVRRGRAIWPWAALAVAALAVGVAWSWLGPSRSQVPPVPTVPVIPEVAVAPVAPVVQEPVTRAPTPAPEPARPPAPAPRPWRKGTSTQARTTTSAPGEPTREALLKRIDELRLRVQSSAPPGGSPNPMMLSLLGRQDAAARAAADGPARAKVARSLDAFEHQFEQSGDLKHR